MLKQLPIKRAHLFILAVLALLTLSYQLAFKKTLAAWQLNHRLNDQLAQSTNFSVQPQYQQRKKANLDKIIALYRADSSEFRGNILTEIAEIADKEDVKLSEVPLRDPLYHSGDAIIQRLNFEGKYPALVKLLARLQTTRGTGMVRSATFKTVTDPSAKEKTKKLQLMVLSEIYDK